MKNPELLTFLLLASSIVCIGQISGAKVEESEPQKIERLEAEWNKANEVSDPEAKHRLLAPDSYHVGPSGRTYNNSQDIQMARASEAARVPGESFKYETSDQNIRIFDGIAVVTGTGRSIKGKDPIKLGTPFRFVHIWEKRNGTWLLIVDQVTAVR